ncbi:hypothetical protein BJ138DRAFT_1020054, partial [Hygrophoropsis aurantiaca]
MNRPHRKAPWTGVILSDDEDKVQLFDAENADCCTADTFQIDLRPGQTARSAWNASATAVFVESFLAHDYACTSRPNIKKAFSSHIRSLARAYQDQLPDSQVGKRRERRRSLFKKRLEVVLKYPDLRRHAEMLMRFGPDGMSSDESAHENNYAQYKILVKPWRHQKVTTWLRTIDAIYRHDRFGPVGRGNHGNNFRARFESTLVSERRSAVRRLP